MGLKGQLEDLPLIDMLQIVAFSKKSGYLRVSSPLGRGAVVLEEGRVLFAYSWSTVPGLRELARRPEGISSDLVRAHIEASLRELAGTREGSFEFELAESISDELGGVKIRPFILPGGLDPQELLLDLAVEIDNERREATSLLELAYQGAPPPEEAEIHQDEDLPLDSELDAPPEPARAPEPPPSKERAVAAAPAHAAPAPVQAAPSPDPRELTVVLVDDEAPVRDVVGGALSSMGYRVVTASTPAGGADLVRKRVALGERVLVVVDLKMPTSSERSFYGGFELIRRLERSGLELPLLLVVENLSEKARARAKELGVRRLAHKPTLTKLDPDLYRADLRDFAGTVAEQLGKLVADAPGPVQESGNGSADPGASARTRFIAEMTKRLVEPRGSTDVSRLLLQVAEHFLERGVLFVVKGDAARGLAGFGIAPDEKTSAELAQRITIDVAECPPVEEVVRTGATLRMNREHACLVEPLFAHVGRGSAQEGVMIPLLFNRATLLLLFGDNAVTGRPLASLSELELFVAQAGMALENKLLQRKLSTVDSHVSENLGRSAALGSSG